MKNLKTLSFLDLAQYFEKFLFWTVVLLGLYVWLFRFIPTVFLEKENFRFVFTRHCFYYLQIVITTMGLVLLHVSIKNEIKTRNIVFNFMLSSALVSFGFFHYIHDVFKHNNVYLDIFKTNKTHDAVMSFQYSRIFMIAVICIFAIGSFLFMKRSVLKIFLAFLCAGYFIFFYFMHLYIGRQAYIEYESNLRIQIHMVLDNNGQHEKLCQKLNYQCIVVPNDKTFTSSTPDVKNRVDAKMDSTEESNLLIDKLLKEFVASNENQKIYMESNILTDNLRGETFAFQKLGANQTMVLIDYVNLAYALDLYVIYFMIMMNVFLLIWITGVMWLYKIHKKMPVMKKLGLE